MTQKGRLSEKLVTQPSEYSLSTSQGEFANMGLNVKSFVEVLLHTLLFVFFMAFFGIPAVSKYKRKETITISSLELTHGIEAPTVTLIGVSTIIGTGS